MTAADSGSPEAAMRAVCEAVLAGDMYTALGHFTPDAMNDLMAMTAGVMQAPSISGYAIESYVQDGEDHRFGVRFHTAEGAISGEATWRRLGGIWRITAIRVT